MCTSSKNNIQDFSKKYFVPNLNLQLQLKKENALNLWVTSKILCLSLREVTNKDGFVIFK